MTPLSAELPGIHADYLINVHMSRVQPCGTATLKLGQQPKQIIVVKELLSSLAKLHR